MIASKEVKTIHLNSNYHSVMLPMWVLYKHPKDHPTKYVLRLWDGATNTPRSLIYLADDMEQIHREIGGRFSRLERFNDDEPHIMAVYL